MKIYNKQTNMRLHDDLLRALAGFRKARRFDPRACLQKKSALLNSYMRHFNLSACVVGVSGGVDSAVTLALVKHASQEKRSPIRKILAVMLPVFTSGAATNQREATRRGIATARACGLKATIIDLTKSHRVLKSEVDQKLHTRGKSWASGQLVAYARTPALYYTTSVLAERGYPAIVCGTTNRDEGAYLGYIGKASDGMVDVQLISDLHKSEVYTLARELNVSEDIIRAIPTGDMYDGRTDEEVFGATYDFVELYLHFLCLPALAQQRLRGAWTVTAKKQFAALAKRIESLHLYNLHKYLSKSPAVHLDVYQSAVPGGWPKSRVIKQLHLR